MATDQLRRLFVRCPNCDSIFPSGFRVISPIQLVGFSHLCPRCRMLVRCDPPGYLEKVGDEFKKSLTDDEIFASPPLKRIEIMGPDLFRLDKEIIATADAVLTSDRAIVLYWEDA